jgi:hypothetical protein
MQPYDATCCLTTVLSGQSPFPHHILRERARVHQVGWQGQNWVCLTFEKDAGILLHMVILAARLGLCQHFAAARELGAPGQRVIPQ